MKTLSLICLVLGAGVTTIAALQADIEYASVAGESLRLDAWVPEGAGPFPAVILVHGGGWNAGDKSGGPSKGYIVPMHEPLARAGFAWFSINYRLAPKHPYPACIEDVETAIRWVKAHATEFHVDPARIALSGESAGGHLVALAAVRMTDATRLAAVIPFYGRHDLIGPVMKGDKLLPNIALLFGRETLDDETGARLREASPLNRIKPGLPPFLILHGTADETVPYQQSVALAARLSVSGVPCDFISIKGGRHGMVNWGEVAPDYGDQVVAWLRKTLQTDGLKPH